MHLIRFLTLPLCLWLAACSARSGVVPVAAASDRASTAYDAQLGIVFTPTGWPRALTADLYRPATDRPAPAVVAIHGGGWDARDRSDMTPVAKKLAARGYAVLNIDYRLAPEFLHPAQLDDVREAIRWLRHNAAQLNVDPQRIAAWGYSAGGQLAALAAADAPDDATRLEAVVAGGTPADLPHYPVSPIITRYLGVSYAQDPRRWIDASPVAHVNAQTPPMFLYHGTWDRLVAVEDTIKLRDALVHAGVPTELYLVHGAGHLATFLFGFGAETAGIEFLDSVLRNGGAPMRATSTEGSSS